MCFVNATVDKHIAKNRMSTRLAIASNREEVTQSVQTAAARQHHQTCMNCPTHVTQTCAVTGMRSKIQLQHDVPKSSTVMCQQAVPLWEGDGCPIQSGCVSSWDIQGGSFSEMAKSKARTFCFCTGHFGFARDILFQLRMF